ncbi:MAG: hypothetical protein ABUK01_12550 [Leptospirales bacterium]
MKIFPSTEIVQNIDLNVLIPRHLLNAAKYVEEVLHENGFEGFLVGGSVRDLLLDRKISDLDYTTNALPEDLKKIFPKVIPVGEKFGTLIILYHHISIEVTTYRKEGKYIDGRRPEHIQFGLKLDEDVHRRDFTINGLAYSVRNKKLHDYIGGIIDLQKKIIRTIGNPLDRFEEDGLRPIRGCRLMANLGFQIDTQTESAMIQKLDIVSKVAPERFFDEWRKTLRVRDKDIYWNTLKKTGIFHLFFKEFKNLINNPTNWDELLFAIGHSMPGVMGVYMAHFFYFELHNSLRLTIEKNKPALTFIRHFFEQNRFPKVVEKLCHDLVFSPLLPVFEMAIDKNIDPVTLKKALANIEKDHWFFHLRFCKEVIISKLKEEERESIYYDFALKTIRYIRGFVHKKEAIYIKDIAISGNDIMALGFSGKSVGFVLQQLQEIVIISPEKNNKNELLKLVKTIVI